MRRAYDYWQDQPGCYAWLGGENLNKSRNSYRPTHAVPLLPPREGQEVDHIIGLGCPPCVLTMMAIESNASKAPKSYFGTPHACSPFQKPSLLTLRPHSVSQVTRVSVSCRRLNQLQRASVWGPISLAEDKSKDCSLLAPEQRRGSH